MRAMLCTTARGSVNWRALDGPIEMKFELARDMDAGRARCGGRLGLRLRKSKAARHGGHARTAAVQRKRPEIKVYSPMKYCVGRSGGGMLGNEQSWFGSERIYIPRWMRKMFSIIVQYLVAVGGSMVIGFVPEAVLGRAYYNTGLEPYSPAIALIAFLLGYFVSVHIRKGQMAHFVWVLGALWLIYGIFDTMSGWSASWSPERTRWGYTLANLFGPTKNCGGSECLGELLFTTPFAASITYSIGAFIRDRRGAR